MNTFKIFVANIPWTVGNMQLKKHFQNFGPVKFAEIIFDWKTGLSKGYGFVVFKTKEGAEKALEHNKQVLEGGKILVREAVTD